jgi:hypothetical protein
MEFWKGANGQQPGDPAKFAQALITITNEKKLPQRFLSGADAICTVVQVAETLLQQTNSYRDLSNSLAFEKNKESNTLLY